MVKGRLSLYGRANHSPSQRVTSDATFQWLGGNNCESQTERIVGRKVGGGGGEEKGGGRVVVV